MKILIAGASGVVGAAAVDRFLARDDFEVVALSRRRPEVESVRDFEHLSVDLRDADAAKAVLDGLSGVTHVLYAALFEKPGLMAGWEEGDQMETNRKMLMNCIEPLVAAGSLRQVTLMQGTKAYANHLKPMSIPARESLPRDDHPNFYWLQQDYLTERSAEAEFDWAILRPQVIFGGAIGAAMNLVPAIGAYSAICAELDQPFTFSGGPSFVWEAVDARLVAAAAEFAAIDPAAASQIYNVTNGDVFEWRNMWPALAEQFGVETGPDEERSMGEWMPAHSDVWDRIVEKHGLRKNSLATLLGESHHYMDFCFAYGADEAPTPMFVSAVKLRQAGVTEFYDTTESFCYWADWLQRRKILPGIGD